jgi:hypothetical protein
MRFQPVVSGVEIYFYRDAEWERIYHFIFDDFA